MAGWFVRARRALRTRWLRQPPLQVWYHPGYRLPLPELRERTGLDPRRADLALWALDAAGNRHRRALHCPGRIAWGHLAMVHTAEHLEATTRPLELSRMFGLDEPYFPVDTVLNAVRRAASGTLSATRYVLQHGGTALNLLGGFHHAFPDRGSGLCPVNDLAVAVAVARADGFSGRVVILDLDAHPPDGTAACLVRDPEVWIGSLSGSDWGPLPRVDETLLEPGTGDEAYLRALHALLDRAPRAELVMVVAGADVVAGDFFGRLGLSPEGVARRDQVVKAWLRDTPSVWLPGGGYREDAWRTLASTAVALLGPDGRPIPDTLDPMSFHFDTIAARLSPDALAGHAAEEDDALFTQAEVDQMFGKGLVSHEPKLLGYYTEEGLEYGLYAFGILTQLRRLGYDHFHIEVDQASAGDRFRLFGKADGTRHMLVEIVLDREVLQGHPMLYLNWMTLRHPLGRFAPGRPQLPGQDVPGLGMAREASELLRLIVARLELHGVILRPAWYHTARIAASHFRFLDPTVQGEFEAIQRDLGHVPLPRLTHAIAKGEVLRHGEPYTWPAEAMVSWVTPPETDDHEAVAAAREAAHFTLPGADDDPHPAVGGPT